MIKVWRLSAKSDQRFRSGHPWVYSNELQESPKGIELGAPVELQDAGGKFLARGYGNPQSLIAFRALTRQQEIVNPLAPEELTKALKRALSVRLRAGMGDYSYRLCFGEADSLPGLIIDRYKVAEAQQVFVIQMHTAGMDRLQPVILQILEATVGNANSWDKSAVILNNDISVRKLEGVPLEAPRALKEVAGLNLSKLKIQIMPALSGKPLEFETDLLGGQKTGFFLDQMANIQLAAQRLRCLKGKSGKIKVLDLCCYVGQWGAQLSRVFKEQGLDVEVVAVDASQSALDRTTANVQAQGGRCTPMKADVMTGLTTLKDQDFDLVVCDPPALIKGRKDIPAGTHAYLQLNTQVFRVVKRGGAVVSCSCSGLLEEDAFEKMLSKAAYRNKVSVRWIARGTQAPDHPVLMEFPEGRYLKCQIGLIDGSLTE